MAGLNAPLNDGAGAEPDASPRSASGPDSSPARSPGGRPACEKVAALPEQVVAAAVAPEAPLERSDAADLIRHVQRQARPAGDPEQAAAFTRARSWCDAEHRQATAPEVSEYRRSLCAPGGFRRDHLHARADELGLASGDRPAEWSVSLVESLVESVRIYEHSFGMPLVDDTGRPLAEADSAGGRGMGSLGLALAIFKGNIGSNILYMPRAFQQGGYVVSGLVIPFLATLSIFCVMRLISCRTERSESFGDLMGRAVGRPGRVAVNVCVVFLQIGTCCTYLINVASMLQGYTNNRIPRSTLILCEAGLIAPFVLIRNVVKLSPVNVVGGVMTIFGILTVFGMLAGELVARGNLAEVSPSNPSGVLVCVGIACFSFEGIGLVIPFYDSCRNQRRFPLVYSMTILFILALIMAMSVLGYLSFGQDTSTLILLNLPRSKLTNFVQCMFTVVMLASFPLQLLPAIRIVEGLFLEPSRPFTWDKHIKSAFRVLFLLLLAGVSVVGATSLDHFVGLIGAVCGLPLAFIFPAVCHRRLVAQPGSFAALVDSALVLFGLTVTVVVGYSGIATWGA